MARLESNCCRSCCSRSVKTSTSCWTLEDVTGVGDGECGDCDGRDSVVVDNVCLCGGGGVDRVAVDADCAIFLRSRASAAWSRNLTVSGNVDFKVCFGWTLCIVWGWLLTRFEDPVPMMVASRGSVLSIGPIVSKVVSSSMSIVRSIVGTEVGAGDTSCSDVTTVVDVDVDVGVDVEVDDVDVDWTSANLLSSVFGARPIQASSLVSSDGKDSIATPVVAVEEAIGDFVCAEVHPGSIVAADVAVAGSGDDGAMVASVTVSAPW